MRKLLLATAAIMGATGGLAFAQAPSQGMTAQPWASGPGANNNNNSLGKAEPGANAVPTPGTVVIRLNGRVEADVGAVFTTADRSVAAGFKVNPIGVGSYMRLYPGVDGMAANGMRYGAAIELRQNFMGGNSLSSGVPGVTAASPSGNSSAQTVFVRRAFTYVGTDQLGILRIGTGDGVIGLFDGGVFTTQTWDAGIGNFNGGANQSLSPGNGVGVPFVWLSQAGAEYDNAKIVYLTPQFFGFDFGFQYAPSMGNRFSDSSTGSPYQAAVCSTAGANCISTTTGTDATRWFNQIAVGARYQGSFSGVDVKAMAVYETAGKESFSGTYNTPSPGDASTVPATYRYDNLSFATAAAALSYKGITVAADYIGGSVNGQLAMRPTGGAPTNAVVTGITYANGPFILGAEVGIVDTQGDARMTKVTQRHETEIAFGGTYKAAPGLAFVGEFMHAERHQGGFDFVAGAPGTTRDVKSNSLVFATIVTW